MHNTYKKNTIINVYDRLLIILIVLQIFGTIGGAFQPIRIFIVLMLPLVLFLPRRDKAFFNLHKRDLFFFLFWQCYSIASLFWALSISLAAKEIVYNIINFSLLPIFLILCNRASKPLLSIIKGWVLLFVISIPFALYEFISGVHHYTAEQTHSKIYINFDQIRNYAALAYGNLNGYNQILVYALPFVFGFTLLQKTIKQKIFSLAVMIFLTAFIIMNSSRASILCLAVTTSVFFIQKNHLITGKIKLLFMAAGILFSFLFYDVIFINVLARLGGQDSNGFSDSYREEIIYSGLGTLRENLYLGLGSGNFSIGIEKFSNFSLTQDFIASHNFFLEILVQYGLIIFIMFLFYLARIYLNRKKDSISKFIIVAFILSYAFTSVINSSYHLNTSTWIFLFSIQMFTIFDIKEKYT